MTTWDTDEIVKHKANEILKTHAAAAPRWRRTERSSASSKRAAARQMDPFAEDGAYIYEDDEETPQRVWWREARPEPDYAVSMVVHHGRVLGPRIDAVPASESPRSLSPSDLLKRSIIRASEADDYVAALRNVAALWENIDSISQLAQARSRHLISKIRCPLKLEKSPDVSEHLAKLSVYDEDLGATVKDAIDSVRNLVLYVVEDRPGFALPTIEKGPLGRVSVSWEGSTGRVEWLVAPSELPWPGVNVLAFSRKGKGVEASRETRTMFNAYDVREHFRGVFPR